VTNLQSTGGDWGYARANRGEKSRGRAVLASRPCVGSTGRWLSQKSTCLSEMSNWMRIWGLRLPREFFRLALSALHMLATAPSAAVELHFTAGTAFAPS